jgi:hypothetical protein
MPRALLILSIALLVPLAAVAQEPEDKNIKRTPPTIIFVTPHANDTDLYARRCPFGVHGRISQPLDGGRQYIEFNIYHILDNGDLNYQGGGSVITDEKGEFGVSYRAPFEGWKPGKLRIYGRVNRFPSVKGNAEINIADEQIEPYVPSDLGYPEPKDSGVVIDTDDAKTTKYFVPEKSVFRVRGEFLDEKRFRDAMISSIYVKIVKRELDGTLGRVIYGNALSGVFRDINGQDDRPWFEIEMESPINPNPYYMTIELRDEKGEKTIPWEYDLHVGIVPDEKKDKKEDK